MNFRESKFLYFGWNFTEVFVPKGQIDNKLELVQILACRRIGEKPLSEPMLTWLNDACMRHYEEMSNFGGRLPH